MKARSKTCLDDIPEELVTEGGETIAHFPKKAGFCSDDIPVELSHVKCFEMPYLDEISGLAFETEQLLWLALDNTP